MPVQKLDQKLEEKAYLKFEFPDGAIRILPFYENPIIREDKSANLVSYNPLSRPSTLFAYTGADARRFKVQFFITLPHILEAASYGYNSVYKGTQSKEEEQNKFFKAVTVKDETGSIGNQDIVGAGSFEYHFNKHRALVFDQLGVINEKVDPLETTNPTEMNEALSIAQNKSTIDLINDEKNQWMAIVSKNYKILARAANVILFWINLIRSSVLNNAKNPTQGPPVLRLYGGIMFQAIPCICKSYSLSYDEIAGFDSFSLLPRRIQVELSLEEFRAGDFTEYQVNNIVKRDNVTGWETVLGGPHTVDPIEVNESAGY